jgi:hypothetical protein
MNSHTLEEAISLYLEDALNCFLKELLDETSYHFIHKLPVGIKNGLRKLLVYDKLGVVYNVDSIVTDERIQPVILIESDYVLSEQHSQDKSRWLCKAHPAIRGRYPNIKSSIVVLAGNWSSTSLAMMKRCDIGIVLIPFQLIRDVFFQYEIDFKLNEKDRETAAYAWARYSALTEEERIGIGTEMVNIVKSNLEARILSILGERLESEIDQGNDTVS